MATFRLPTIVRSLLESEPKAILAENISDLPAPDPEFMQTPKGKYKLEEWEVERMRQFQDLKNFGYIQETYSRR
jgi:hypothetical protein